MPPPTLPRRPPRPRAVDPRAPAPPGRPSPRRSTPARSASRSRARSASGWCSTWARRTRPPTACSASCSRSTASGSARRRPTSATSTAGWRRSARRSATTGSSPTPTASTTSRRSRTTARSRWRRRRSAASTRPPRANALRVVVCELARISSHLLGLGAYSMDVGAMTVFLYTFTERETLYNFFEFLTGARFTTCYTRVGGVARDADDGLARGGPRVLRGPAEEGGRVGGAPHAQPHLDAAQRGRRASSTARRRSRTGSRARACAARASAYDVRKDHPYFGYEQYDFDVPGGHARRRVRPLPRPPRGDPPERPDRDPGHRPHARRARSSRTSRSSSCPRRRACSRAWRS